MANAEPAPERKGLTRQFLDSVSRPSGEERADRERKHSRRGSLVFHLHPPTLPERTLRLSLTWGLGGMGLVLVLLLALTGTLLLFVYEPFPGSAYISIHTLQDEVLFGQLVRNIHHWSANLLVIVSLLHLLRVFFTGGYHAPRQFNWLIGLGLLGLVLAANFTGYLLPWDQLSYWAITICTGMIEYLPWLGPRLQKWVRGGAEIGPRTLLIFFTMHTALIPVLLVTAMPFHFWRVRKAGGVVVPPPPDGVDEDRPARVSSVPHLVLRELVAGLALIAFVMVLAVSFNAPLAGEANPGMSPDPAKAPWYFLGLQELLFHFHPLFAVLVIPLALVLGLLLIPYVRYDSIAPGTWFQTANGRRTGLIAAVTGLVATPLAVVIDDQLLRFADWMPGLPNALSEGLLPVTLVLLAIAGFRFWLNKRCRPTRTEMAQALFILLLAAFIVLTVTGIWFRGSGMALCWPWDRGAVAGLSIFTGGP